MSAGVGERKKVAVLSFALLCSALLLTAYSARHPAFARFPTTVVMEIIAPVHAVVDFVEDSGRSVWSSYLALASVAEENQALRAHIVELESERNTLVEFRTENQRLRGLLELGSVSQFKGVSADVIGDEPSGWGHGILVNRGSSHGVGVGMAVVHPRGVVGQVVAVSPNFAHVLLVTDHSSGVDVMTQDSRVRGVVEGIGAEHCELRYVSKEMPVRVGDIVITSGMDGVFPKGLPVGSVSKLATETGTLLQNIEIAASVDFDKLEEVLVVTGGSAQEARIEEVKVLVKEINSGKRRE